jgi:D-alanyl-D-alanine carboxypeptidase (penicillin-binding protein 5/6)
MPSPLRRRERPPRLVAAAVAAALVIVGLASGPAAAAPPTTPLPCPTAKVPPLAGAKPPPAKPVPPPRPDDAPAIGGDRLASPGLVLPDGAPALPATISAQAWVVADLDTGDILGACAPHVQHLPASTQKLLTALTALPKLDPKQVVTVTDADLAIERGSSAVGLVKGGRYTVETIALGMLLNSGNDAANVLARLAGGAGGIPGGVLAMNTEARRIGAFDTTAVTPSGLDGPGQFTSAYDLALIARADFAIPSFRTYTATQRTVIPGQPPKFPSFQIQNENKLLQRYPGAIGGKTGFTDLARHTYVGAAQRNGRRLVVTLLRGEHRPLKLWQQGAALLDWGFKIPAGTEPVGRLVRPEDVIPKAAPVLPALAVTRDTGPAGGQGSGLRRAGIGAGAAATALFVTVAGLRLRVLRRRRARRAPAWRDGF